MNGNKVLDKAFMEEIEKIVDDKSLREFCLEKNKWRQTDKKNKLIPREQMVLSVQIYKNIFSQNKKLSIETCVELGKLLSGNCSRFCGFNTIQRKFVDNFKNLGDNNAPTLQAFWADFKIYKHLSIYSVETKKIENMGEVFEFIKKHKDTNNAPQDVENYLNLILNFLALDCFDSTNCHVADFLDLHLLDFSNPSSYDELFFYSLRVLLLSYLRKDKDNQQVTVETLKNILNNAPDTILTLSETMNILNCFRKNRVNFSMDSAMIKKLFSECNSKDNFDCMSLDSLIMIWSLLEDNSLPGEIMDKMLDGFCKYREEREKNGIRRDESEEVWATPSLINFMKQKLNSNHNYPLEQKLKEKFQNDICNADNVYFCLNKFFVRYCFEVSERIPHRKHDVVEMLKGNLRYEINHVHQRSEKVKVKDQLVFLFRKNCGYDITSEYEKAGIFDEVCKEFDGFVKAIFEEKGLVATEVNENNQPNCHLTIQEIRMIVLSNFKFGDYGITKEKFQSLLMDKIDDIDHFEWLLQVHIGQDAPIEISDLCCYVKHLKIDSLWMLNKYLSTIAINTNGKINKTVLSALLDVYDGSEPLIFDKEHDPDEMKKFRFDNIKKLVYKFEDQSLIDKFNEKFKPTIENIDEPHVEMVEGVEQKVEISTSPENTENNLQNPQMDDKDTGQEESKTPIWLVILEKIAYCLWFVFTLGSPIWAPSLTEKLFPGPKILKSDQNKNKVDKSILPDTSEDKSKDKKDKNIKLEDDNKNRDVK